MPDFRHLAIHIYNIGVALFRSVTPTTCLVNIISRTFSLFISDGIRIHHITRDFHSPVIFWYDDAVAFAQHNVFITTRMLQRLLKVNADRVGVTKF